MGKNKEKLINTALFFQHLSSLWRKIRILTYLTSFAVVIILVNKYFLASEEVNHNLILRYLKVLQWPIVILVLGIVFRPYLPEIVQRAREIGPGGVKLDPPQQEKVALENEKAFQDVTEKSDVVDLQTDGGRKKALRDFQLKWSLEKVYRNIYGTQIDALIRLNAFPDGLGDGQLMDIYTRHRSLAPNPHPNLTEFTQYLASFGLVSFEPSKRIYKITDIGRLFLDYIKEEGILYSPKAL